MLKFEAPKGPAQPSAAETRPACTAVVPRELRVRVVVHACEHGHDEVRLWQVEGL